MYIRTQKQFVASLLGQSFTFPLEQAVARLSSLQLTIHLPQSLSGWEDRLPLDGVSALVISCTMKASYPRA